MSKKMMLACLVVLVLVGGAIVLLFPFGTAHAPTAQQAEPANFAECVAAGYPVMESYPRQCNTPHGGHFVEEIASSSPATYTTTKGETDLIRITSPRPGERVTSPLTIQGQARGTWYFEASFPVVLTDWDGKIIAQIPAQAKGDPTTGEVNWMTEDFVPFEATLTFDTPAAGDPAVNRGTLILQKDNPSGLPEKEDALEIPVTF